jgi:signal transduction histidine kinase
MQPTSHLAAACAGEGSGFARNGGQRWAARKRRLSCFGGATTHIDCVLDDFILANRDAIITTAQSRVALRTSPKPSDLELTNGIPVFLDQLGAALRLAKSTDVIAHEQISKSAGRHGSDLLRMGLTIGQVVHDYGDVCQSITELAVRQDVAIPAQDFKTLNLCLDDAIAEAVTEYSDQREHTIADQGTERLGILAHELRNLLNTATLTFESIKSGRVAAGGSTGMVHARSLIGLSDLIDRSLADVRLDAGIEHFERISVAAFIEEIEIGALLHARARGLSFAVTSVDREVTIEGDRQILAAAVSNLLRNAFKFTRKEGNVFLTARASSDRVFFEIEDECGGLPPGKTEDLFRPFEQRGRDLSGVGLGLSICLKAAKANGGEIRVRDLPGKGCVFTLDLPRKPHLPGPR